MDEMNLSTLAPEASMVTLLSSVSVAISLARAAGTLRVTREFNTRLGVEFWAIQDDRGTIATALSEAEAQRMAA
jgi:hypothetical protein